MTDLQYHSRGESAPSKTLSDPVVLELEIYTDVIAQASRLQYVDGNALAWDVDPIELEVPAAAAAPTIKFIWRDTNTPEIINTTSTPTPTRTTGAGFTEYTVPPPSTANAQFVYEFDGGDPGFHLKVTVKRK